MLFSDYFLGKDLGVHDIFQVVLWENCLSPKIHLESPVIIPNHKYLQRSMSGNSTSIKYQVATFVLGGKSHTIATLDQWKRKKRLFLATKSIKNNQTA